MRNTIIAYFFMVSILCSQSAHAYTWVQHHSNEMVRSIALDGDYIWCATDSGVVRYDKSDGSTVRYTEKDGLTYNKVSAIAIDHNGIKWFGTEEGVSRFDGSTWINYRLDEGLNDPRVNSIVEINDQVICFGTEHDLYTFDGNNWNHFWWGNVWKIIKDKNDMLWSDSEFFVLKGDFNGNIIDLHETEPNLYYSVAIDSNAVLWFGGEFDVLKYDGKTWESINYDMYHIREIEIDKNNTLWLGDEAYGLYSYDGKEFIRYVDPAGDDNAIFSIKIDESGVIWTGGSKGLQSFHPDPVEVKDQKPMSDLKILKNAPNPFNPSTTIEFTLPFSGKANLTVYDIMGRKVRELVSGQVSAGMRTALWDGRDDSGRDVSSGVYFARLTMGKSVAVRKMLMIK